jgi:CheY-like chemotaxis protein
MALIQFRHPQNTISLFDLSPDERMATVATNNSGEAPGASASRTFLVVDDSPIDALIAGKLLAQFGTVNVVYAENGVQALEVIDQSKPDLILTDLQMPEMDGLQLVESIRRLHPSVPTILMTAHGSEDIALRALRRGAASYVPKRMLSSELLETVRQIVELSFAGEQQRRILGSWERLGIEFRLENDSALIPPLVSHLQQYHTGVSDYDETESIRVGVALQEALRNAMHHGNLELNSEMRRKNSDEYYRVATERQRQQPYQSRRVQFAVNESPAESTYVIRDEGPGFDPDSVVDPLNADNLLKPSGRGLFLIRTFMSEVRFNDQGNEITMIHRRSRPDTHDTETSIENGAQHQTEI